MDLTFLLVTLALGTMLAVVLFALLSKKNVEYRRNDPDSKRSTLAKDGPSHGAPQDV